MELENSSRQIPEFVYRLGIDVGKIFTKPFDEKSKHYDDYVILAALHF